jgi:hypothetical protein
MSTSQTPSADQTRALAELLRDYVQGALTDIDTILLSAESKAREIPKVPGLARELDAHGQVLGELLIRLTVLEQAVGELLEANGRQPLSTNTGRTTLTPPTPLRPTFTPPDWARGSGSGA